MCRCIAGNYGNRIRAVGAVDGHAARTRQRTDRFEMIEADRRVTTDDNAAFVVLWTLVKGKRSTRDHVQRVANAADWIASVNEDGQSCRRRDVKGIAAIAAGNAKRFKAGVIHCQQRTNGHQSIGGGDRLGRSGAVDREPVVTAKCVHGQ